MSYARKGADSDVYVYEAAKTRPVEWVCFECRLISNFHHVTYSQADMIDHLHEHIRRGHKVPPSAIEQLYQEVDTANPV